MLADNVSEQIKRAETIKSIIDYRDRHFSDLKYVNLRK